MALPMGSVTVTNTAAPFTPAPGPGGLVLTNSGTQAVVVGGSGVTPTSVGPGVAVIPPNQSVSLGLVGSVGTLYAVATAGGSVLSWFSGTELM